jgi:2-iminobutanoate/2-iminopropanoate deaminase
MLRKNHLKQIHMATQRRSVLKKLFASVLGVTGVAAAAKAASPDETKEHKVFVQTQQPKLFPGVSVYNGLVYLSGVGYHKAPFDITTHTTEVLKQIKDNLEAAGSSMEKVLKVNVYLNDIADYKAMNDAYKGHFGVISGKSPVRTTVAVAKGGVPGDSLVEIDCIAYI